MVCAYNNISLWNWVKTSGFLKFCHRDEDSELGLSMERNLSWSQQMKAYKYKERKVLIGNSLWQWENMILSKNLFSVGRLLCSLKTIILKKNIFVTILLLLLAFFLNKVWCILMNHECLFKQIYTAQCTDWLCSMTTSSIINLWPEFKPENAYHETQKSKETQESYLELLSAKSCSSGSEKFRSLVM